MTIGIGVIDHETKKIVVAADTLVTYGSELKKDAGTKFLETEKECLVVGAGSVRLCQLFNLLMREQPNLLDFKSLLDVIVIADAFYDKVSSIGVGEAENNDTPSHDFEILLANTLSPYIYMIEGDYSVEQSTDYVCIGSGFVQAQSSLHTLYSIGVKGQKALDQAMKTTLTLHPFCGGAIEVRSLPLS